MTEEHVIQNDIRLQTAHLAVLFRTNSGVFWQGTPVFSKEFNQTILINLRKIEGLPEGHSDLAGVRCSDGRAVYIEVKKRCGKTTKKQENFLAKMQSHGAIAGVCHSAKDAIKLLEE